VPVVLALSGLGWAAAHAFAQGVGMPETGMTGSSGMQGYLSYLPTSLALCLALALPLAAGAAVGKRWTGTSGRMLWLFGVVPVLGFAGHTLGEPLILGSGTAASLTELAPIVLVGLLIQIPFALVALGLARRILWLAASLARALARPERCFLGPERGSYLPPRADREPAFRLDLGRSPRAPPLLAA